MHVTTINEEEDVGMKESEEGRKGRKKCYTEITISKKNPQKVYSMFVHCFLYMVLGINFLFSLNFVL